MLMNLQNTIQKFVCLKLLFGVCKPTNLSLTNYVMYKKIDSISLIKPKFKHKYFDQIEFISQYNITIMLVWNHYVHIVSSKFSSYKSFHQRFCLSLLGEHHCKLAPRLVHLHHPRVFNIGVSRRWLGGGRS